MPVQTLSNFSIYSELKICGKTSFFRSKFTSFLKISYLAAVWELSWPKLIWVRCGLCTCPVFDHFCPSSLDVYSYCRILIPSCVSVGCLCLPNSMCPHMTFQDCKWSTLTLTASCRGENLRATADLVKYLVLFWYSYDLTSVFSPVYFQVCLCEGGSLVICWDFEKKNVTKEVKTFLSKIFLISMKKHVCVELTNVRDYMYFM